MSKLPDELADLAELEKLDISHNAFINLPLVAYRIPKLTTLNASHNHIIGKPKYVVAEGLSDQRRLFT